VEDLEVILEVEFLQEPEDALGAGIVQPVGGVSAMI
jgi:hypothetical protein